MELNVSETYRSYRKQSGAQSTVAPADLKACKLLKQIHFLFSGVPCYADEEIDNICALQLAPADELDEYKQVSASRRAPMILSMMVSFLHSAKDFAGPVYELQLFDHRKLASDVELSAQTGVTKFTCISTDCVSLSKESALAQDVVSLPVLEICSPNVRSLYNPIVILGTAGIFTHLTTSLSVLFLCTLVPLHHFVIRAKLESIMFIVAPVATTSIVRDKIRRLMLDSSCSHLNYRAIWPNRSNRQRKKVNPDELGTKKAKPYSYFEETNDDQIDVCLPVVRTVWWRLQISSIHRRIFTVTFLGTLLFVAAICVITSLAIEYKLEQLKDYSSYMKQSGCKIWTTTGEKLVDLEAMLQQWTWLSVLDVAFVSVMTTVTVCTTSSQFLLSTCELFIWLDELIVLTRQTVEFVALQNHIRRPMDKLGSDDVRLEGHFCLAKMRARYLGAFTTKLSLPLHNEMTSKERYDEQQFIVELSSSCEGRRAVSVELMERLYISFRLFTQSVKESSPFMGGIVILCNLLNYGLVLSGFYSTRMIGSFLYTPLLVMVASLVSINLLILMIARFHAKVSNGCCWQVVEISPADSNGATKTDAKQARRLQPLLWTLIAQTSDSREPRLGHLRLLWLKQARILDSEGGIAMGAFGLRITYVYLIQVRLSPRCSPTLEKRPANSSKVATNLDNNYPPVRCKVLSS